MPDMRQVALEWVCFLKDHFPEEQYKKLYSLVENVPEDLHMMHGDYHIKNIMLQDGEALLIDMDTLCFGHPVFELASMYNAYIGYAAVDHTEVEKFLGISYDTACAFWEKSLKKYLGTEDEARIREVEEKARIIGYTRIMRRAIRRESTEKEDWSAMIEHCRKELAELLPRVETLLF
jgi:thiamine kinase-like enzyme